MKIFLTLALLFITSCAGGGTKNISQLPLDDKSDKVRLFFSRPYDFNTGAIQGGIYVNGDKIGNLGGSGEYLSHTIAPGNFTIKVGTDNFVLTPVSGDSLSGIGKSGDRFFYIVSIQSQLLNWNWKINETTYNGFKQSQ